MKRSRKICLLVLGTTALLAGCADEKRDLTQGQYASQADCEKDWGEPQVCTPHSGGVGYVGPRYYWNHAGGNPVAVMPDGSERAMTHSSIHPSGSSLARSSSIVSRGVSVSRGGFGVSRGGFGSTAHFGSAGG